MADRVLFPNGFTTADLVDTYMQLAPVLLPHLRNRPLTLKPFPTTIATRRSGRSMPQAAPQVSEI
jgi:DNA primase